ncbi:DNAJ heat shock N-terminal domain-containing protein [Striga hermonthica]|uniref:DNAJ heat shock N-terminal domain-containing protein n=1 Tax=Striga hermonthica TaxID=68872 RepID=A0A9N7NC73_STRHE|nr:DNAJ heat shock N-terminal domain-containing protein [Striga hermonthica]
MGGHSRKSRSRKSSPEPSTSASADSSSPSSDAASSSDSQLESSSKVRKRRRNRDRDREDSKRRNKKSRRDSERRKKTRRKHSRRDRERQKRKERKKGRYDSDDESGSGSGSSSDSERESPEDVVKFVLKEFPAVAGDLEQLLRMIDDGQAVDIRGLSEKSLVKHLRRLFKSLNLKENGDRVFLLPRKAGPTLDVVGPIIHSHLQPQKELSHLDLPTDAPSVPPEPKAVHAKDNVDNAKEDAVGPRKRIIGPAMPSAELLAAAAKLTEAEAELRDAELYGDDESFIGPPPPALVKEAESANEAERFEEITRIIGAEEDSPYDILGVNNHMSAEGMKKRYWKLSLMVHPDKSSHPQAHQAFVKLNKAFKDLQDPDKRKVLDDKIKQKEEQDAFKAELKAMREAAQWRRLQGISMEGDDILLAEMDEKVAPKRDEWMTTLPPERKPGVSMHSTRTFSKSSKEGRGDTSAWTDTPLERAQKAKMNYLEAYNEAAALASNEQEKKKPNPDAELVDQYNKARRSKSLVEKHKESRPKKKSKQEKEKEEWEGNHPWKPWDREKDLTAGRKSIKFDSENMAQGLSSRFSSGNFQRNFL